jgi:hypothetical protein
MKTQIFAFCLSLGVICVGLFAISCSDKGKRHIYKMVMQPLNGLNTKGTIQYTKAWSRHR